MCTVYCCVAIVDKKYGQVVGCFCWVSTCGCTNPTNKPPSDPTNFDDDKSSKFVACPYFDDVGIACKYEQLLHGQRMDMPGILMILSSSKFVESKSGFYVRLVQLHVETQKIIPPPWHTFSQRRRRNNQPCAYLLVPIALTIGTNG